MGKPKFALRHTDGRYYSFAGGDIYDGPQFSRDWRNAKLMTIQGATSVQKRLASNGTANDLSWCRRAKLLEKIMTNNPTIDGVSRELLQNLLHCGDTASTITPYVTERIRELLDAPAVERQETDAIIEGCMTSVGITHAIYASTLTLKDKEQVRLYREPPEVTALQSTIARLEARITKLESEKKFSAATYQAARDRIAELESGRGEIAGFRYRANGDWEWMDESPFADGRTHYKLGGEELQPLFTDPPAPVAALWEICMPDEPGNPESPCEYVYVNSVAGRDLLLLREGSSVYAEYACLDATAALNGPAK